MVKPFRVKRNLVVKAGELERSLQVMLLDRQNVSAVLVLLDADDDCPAELAPQLLERCARVSPVPISVVFAVRELEAWFLGGVESLRGQRGIRDDASYDADPEAPRGAKERLEGVMNGTCVDVADQPALMASLDIDVARRRCASFDKLLRDLDTLGVLP